jgi:hypothetical protein
VSCPVNTLQNVTHTSKQRCQSIGAANKMHGSFALLRMTSRNYAAYFRDTTLESNRDNTPPLMRLGQRRFRILSPELSYWV